MLTKQWKIWMANISHHIHLNIVNNPDLPSFFACFNTFIFFFAKFCLEGPEKFISFFVLAFQHQTQLVNVEDISKNVINCQGLPLEETPFGIWFGLYFPYQVLFRFKSKGTTELLANMIDRAVMFGLSFEKQQTTNI